MISCLPSARGKAEVDVRAVTPERGRLGERLIVVEFGEHHILDEMFVVKDDDPVGHIPTVFEVMGDGEQSALVGAKLVDVIDEQRAGDRIDGVAWLVEHDDMRVEQHAGDDADPFAQTGREWMDWQRCVGLFLEGFSLLCELHGAQVPEGRVEPLVVVPPHVPVDVRA